MSVRSTRTSRRRSADPEADAEEPTAQEIPQTTTQTGRSKRQRSNTADPDAGAATGAAAAAGAYEQTPGSGAPGAGSMPMMQQQQQVAISQQDIDSLQEAIEHIKKEADEAEAKGDAQGFTRTAMDSAVARVVRLMLFKNYDKPDVPVKRQELNDVIQKDVTHRVGRGGNKLPGVVLPLAAAKLAATFGLELREIKRAAGGAAPARGAAAAAGADGSGGSAAGGSVTQTYVLRSLLQPTLLTRFVHESGEDAMRGLMTVAVALLQLAPDGQIEADELWQQLSQLGVEKEPEPGYDRDDQASTFSNKDGAAGVLAHMERCRYVLKKSIAAATGGLQTVYKLAEAAEDELGAAAKTLTSQWLGTTNEDEDGQ